MGYEVTRFSGEVNEELVCSICSGVFENPVQVPGCEHVFCRQCITEWIGNHPVCPVDRQPIASTELRPVPRIFRNLLSKLSVSCDHVAHGCKAVLKLEVVRSHLVDCEYDPKRPMPCQSGCGLDIPKDEFKGHSCVRVLRSMLETQQASIAELQREIAEKNNGDQSLLKTQSSVSELKYEIADQRATIERVQVQLATQHAIITELQHEMAIQHSSSKRDKGQKGKTSVSATGSGFVGLFGSTAQY